MSGLALGKAAMQWALWNSTGADLIVLLVLLAQYFVGDRISARWRYNLWLLVIARLVLPTMPGIRVEVPHWARLGGAERGSGVALRWAPGLVGSGSRVQAEKRPVPSGQIELTSERFVPMPAEGAPFFEKSEGRPAPQGEASDGAIAVSIGRDNHVIDLHPESPAAKAGNAANPTPTPPVTQPPRGIAKQAGPTARAVPWLVIGQLTWLAGVSIVLLRLALISASLARRTRRLEPIHDPAVRELLNECCQLMRVRRAPIPLAAPADWSPALVGIWRPKLLLPPCVLSDFDRRELRQIVMHELAHLKRRDVAMNYLISVLQALHWFNPLVWLAFARMRADRELACDEAVLHLTPLRECRAYGCTILKLLEVLCRGDVPAGALGAVQHKALMHRRIAMIAQFDPRKRNWSATGTLLSLLLIGAAAVSAVRAQQAPAGLTPPLTAPKDQALNDARQAVDAAGAKAQRPVAAPPAGDVAPAAPDALGAPGALEPPKDSQQGGNRAPTGLPVSRFGPPVGALAASPRPLDMLAEPGAMQNLPPQTPDTFIRNVEDPAAVQANAKTAEKLRHPQASQFNGVPLRDVLSNLADAGGVDIVIDEKSLADLGTDAGSSAVTMNIREPRSLDQLLQLALRLVNPQVDYSLVNGVVFVSSRAELARHVITRAYDLGNADRVELNNLIGNLIGASPAISYYGQQLVVPGVLYFGDKLVVTTSEPNHRKIAKLLAMLGPGTPGSQRHQVGQPGNPSQGSQTLMHVYALKYADAMEMSSVLKSACSANSKLVVDQRTNSLVISGPAEDLKVAEELLQRLDQPGREGDKQAANGLPQWANDALAKMRLLAEQAAVLSSRGANHPDIMMLGKQIDVLGKELDSLGSQLTKEGRDAEATKLRSEMEQIKAILAPLRPNSGLTPPATAR